MCLSVMDVSVAACYLLNSSRELTIFTLVSQIVCIISHKHNKMLKSVAALQSDKEELIIFSP